MIRLTILLTMTALVLAPTAVTAEVPQPWGSRVLRAWLAEATRQNEKRPDTAGINPVIPVLRFYQRVGFRPVWVDPHGLRPQGEYLLSAIGGAAEEGLFPGDYGLSYLGTMRPEGVSFSDGMRLSDREPRIQFELVLSMGLLRYAHHLRQGRVMPETLSRQWSAIRRASTRDIPGELADALKENRLKAYIESLHPSGHAYAGLRNALQQYEQIRRSGGWGTLAPGATMHMGDHGPRVRSLRRHLRITHDLSSAEIMDLDSYDDIVEAAVKRFQRRHGLRADGLVGDRTRAELNIPVEERITQLQLNMERWRWFPDSLGERYLLVNIPAFELSVVETDERVDTLRAIVGKNRRQTPIMSSRMTYLEFNPYWNIPRKIVRRDILPKIIDDPAYLIRQGIKVFDSWDHQARDLDPRVIAWDKISSRHFPYRLRQDPSALNALGRVKFMFPNRQSVYIHDTPGRSLFNRQDRNFSSGCIRVERPLALAHYLLRQQGWDHARLETTVTLGQRQTVVLDDPIPVHLVYFTAWVAADGTVNFREDIYERDRALQIALNNRPSDLVFWSYDPEKNNFLGNCAPLATATEAAAEASEGVVSPIASTGDMAGSPINGL